MSKQLDWDVFRYVLDDPSLDRAAFELRLLHDESLAWAVADAVEQIEQLRVASRFLNKQALLTELATTSVATSNHAAASGWHWSSLAALAATLLLLIGGSSAGLMHWTAQQKNSSNDSLAMRSTSISTQALADRWLALQVVSDGDVPLLDLLSEEPDSRWSMSETSQPGVETGADSVAEDHDWLMEAASLFYADGAAS